MQGLPPGGGVSEGLWAGVGGLWEAGQGLLDTGCELQGLPVLRCGADHPFPIGALL